MYNDMWAQIDDPAEGEFLGGYEENRWTTDDGWVVVAVRSAITGRLWVLWFDGDLDRPPVEAYPVVEGEGE